MDLADAGMKRVLVVTDPWIAKLPPCRTVLESLEHERIGVELFASARVEPTDVSFREAIAFGAAREFDAIVAVGGGSVIDTAKAVNLYTCYPPEDFLDYVNAPVGRAKPIPGVLKPLYAVPTTAGTGSETTGVAIFDYTPMHAKTGIAGRRLKPTIGYIDSGNTRSCPPQVAASAGLDVLCHAIESYTAIPFNERPYPERPLLRPAYQGANPISDLWSMTALRMAAQALPRAVADPDDDEARGQMLLAAAYAGIGFGNAGVHLPHGMSYPVSGMVREFRMAGYPADRALVPHGVSVILNAPAVFRYTGQANPERHLAAAGALGARITGIRNADAGECLADTIAAFIQKLGIPNGLSAIGYTTADIPALVEGTLPQHRVTKLSPRPAGPEELSRIFEDAMKIW